MRLVTEKKKSESESEELTEVEEELSFEETIKKNEEAARKVREQRVKDNKSVTRSYRLK